MVGVVGAMVVTLGGGVPVVVSAWAGQPAAPPPAPQAAPARGESPAALAIGVLEGRVIREVAVTGLTSVPEALVRNQIRSVAGGALDAETVRGDVERLVRLGRFREVNARGVLYDDGTVRLEYRFEETPIIVGVDVVGNRQVSNQDLFPLLEGLANTPVDRFQIDRALRAVRELYVKRGYYTADVTIDETELEKTGILLFRVREGHRVSVVDIRFEGNRAFPAGQLRPQVRSPVWGLFQSGAIDDVQLDQDVAALVEFYRGRGHLDVRVDRRITPSPNGREAILTFLIDEGQRYTVRSVRAELGEPEGPRLRPTGRAPVVISPEQARGLVEIRPGDVFSLDKLRRSVDALREAYGRMGYADARVEYVEVRTPDRPEADVVFVVTEGRRFMTGVVLIRGNELTQQKVIRREVRVFPDRPLDTTGIEQTQRRLTEVRLFDTRPGAIRVTPQPEDPRRPGVRDVLVEVKETNTGSLSFGAAIGSDSGLIGTVSLTQRNFDLADTPDSLGELFTGRAFRGGGQTFDITLQPGTEIQNYTIGLGEPSLFESDYSGNISGGFSSREFDEYLEQRLGAVGGVGRRFGDVWVGSLTARGQQIRISGIAASAPRDVFAVQGTNVLTGLGFRLRRTEIDSGLRATRGSVIDLGVEQVGAFGGNYTFTKLGVDASVFVPLYEDFFGHRTVLKLRASANWIPQKVGRVPVFERFYNGGREFRGFSFRGVGPLGIRNDTGTLGGDPVGGTWSFFFGPQIEQPVFREFVSLVGFVDTGTVTNSPGLADYRVSIGAGLRIYIPQISPAPLAFDFGFPVRKEPGDRRGVFSFSLDLPF